MTVTEQPLAAPLDLPVDERTLEILERRRRTGSFRRRGWLVRRMLVVADVVGLSLAFLGAELVVGVGTGAMDRLTARDEFLAFLLTMPAWIVVAKIYGLYDRDEERPDHNTTDDLVGVFHLVTVGAFLLIAIAWLTGIAHPEISKIVAFWALAIGLVSLARLSARAYCRRNVAYLQNTIIVGAGEVGQLVARKLLQHPEYRINLVGFVDSDPKELRSDVAGVRLLGGSEHLQELVRFLEVERVIVAFSNEQHERQLELIRSLGDLDVQIDIVPRLYEVVGPNVDIHTVEGLPLVGLHPVRLSRSSQLLKRGADVVGASLALIVTAPFFAYIAVRIKLDSPGPVFFRQTRLGLNMRELTMLKFRTMKVDTGEAEHREYVRATMDSSAAPTESGLYKLERDDSITSFGRWLRRTSLDELPQFINVLKGDMSLVGPRPCIAYETEHFAPYHFERFLVPAGITGLWQVTARAHATFGEALDMDVAYARGWSLGLDVWLVLRTPIQLLKQRGGTR